MELRATGRWAARFLLLVVALSVWPPGTGAAQERPALVSLGAIDGSSLRVWSHGQEFAVGLLGIRIVDRQDGLEPERVALLNRVTAGRALAFAACTPRLGDRLVSITDGPARADVGELLLRAGLAIVDEAGLAAAGCDATPLRAAQAAAELEGLGLWDPSRHLDPRAIRVPEAPPSHDWRVPGFVGVVGGRIYDRSCYRMHAAGSNVPNILYRGEWAETLAWMSAHHQRWLRVFVTGHGGGTPTVSAAEAAARLRTFLRFVEEYNATRPRTQSIYVLAVLTDYYQPGVPGDQYAFDNPYWGEQPVLPAFWYRPGFRTFSFDQEHGRPRLPSMPNYEVNYKPWVQTVVSANAASPALLGWQLGNELKARESQRNDVDAAVAYEWYLQFTRDMVDTIRGLDQNHLIFQGAQYMAEATDWGYRPGGAPEPGLVAHYRSLVDRMLGACGRYCWNVWSLTGYDFSPWFLDDAAVFAEQGVAAVITEYGFTRGSPAEMAARYGGDRPAALRTGLARPWFDVRGEVQPRYWGAAELVEQGPAAGIAPWASPAPGPSAGLDADVVRGVTAAPDERDLWMAWREVGQRLALRNAQALVSGRCLVTNSRTLPPAVTR